VGGRDRLEDGQDPLLARLDAQRALLQPRDGEQVLHHAQHPLPLAHRDPQVDARRAVGLEMRTTSTSMEGATTLSGRSGPSSRVTIRIRPAIAA
jgi:hypothetical protein